MKIEVSKLIIPDDDLRASVDTEEISELADSLREVGQLQSIGVVKQDDGNFRVVYGARRTRAFRELGWTHCEANIVKDDDEQTTKAKRLIENVQRVDLTFIEEAYGLAAMIGDGEANVRELQRRTGKSRGWITSRLEILDAPEDIQGAVQAGLLSAGVARELAQIADQQTRQFYVTAAIEHGCSIDVAKQWVNQAQYAQTGFAAMNTSAEVNSDGVVETPIADVVYNCFCCGQPKSWRKVNQLVVCGECQLRIPRERGENVQPQV